MKTTFKTHLFKSAILGILLSLSMVESGGVFQQQGLKLQKTLQTLLGHDGAPEVVVNSLVSLIYNYFDNKIDGDQDVCKQIIKQFLPPTKPGVELLKDQEHFSNSIKAAMEIYKGSSSNIEESTPECKAAMESMNQLDEGEEFRTKILNIAKAFLEADDDSDVCVQAGMELVDGFLEGMTPLKALKRASEIYYRRIEYSDPQSYCKDTIQKIIDNYGRELDHQMKKDEL